MFRYLNIKTYEYSKLHIYEIQDMKIPKDIKSLQDKLNVNLDPHDGNEGYRGNEGYAPPRG
jgi:hypothetical protein